MSSGKTQESISHPDNGLILCEEPEQSFYEDYSVCMLLRAYTNLNSKSQSEQINGVWGQVPLISNSCYEDGLWCLAVDVGWPGWGLGGAGVTYG